MSNEQKFYIVDGKQRVLNRVDSAKLVVPARDNHLGAVSARLARSSRLAIENNVPTNYLVMRGDPGKLEEIRGYRDIQCTRSVFTDENGLELILTNEVLVKFDATLDFDERSRLCEKFNCVIVDDSEDIWCIRVLTLDEDAPLDVANELSNEPGVVFAEPNALQRAALAAVPPPIDRLFAEQWYLDNTGQGGGTVGADVNALDAWEFTYGSPRIRIVIYDTGVDIRHPDLMTNIGPGWDFVHNDADATSNDKSIKDSAHGTTCAGVAAAARNGQGVVGIAPDCKITPLRCYRVTIAVRAKAFKQAAKYGEIISCSWGISPSNTVSSEIRKVINHGRNGKGIPIFFCTGNDADKLWYKGGIWYPALMEEVIAIGATNNRDTRANFSNYGPGIDFVAPGVDIRTTDETSDFGYNENSGTAGDYTEESGTSLATPLAAGIAALMLSVNPSLTAKQIKKIMQETAVKIDRANAKYDADTGWSKEYGYGRLDAAGAVRAANNSRPVALRAHNGQMVRAEGGGGREVLANHNGIYLYETFQLIELGNNKIALRAYNGQYVCAEGGGGSKVVADRNRIGEWETFELVHLSNNKVSLRAYNGQHVCAEHGGGAEVNANRDWVGEWETFELINLRPVKRIALQAHNGQYVRAAGGGGGKVVADRNWIREWETFELIDLGNNRVALRAYNGQHFCAEHGGGAEVNANRNWISGWETFYLVYLSNNKVALRAQNGQHMCAEGGGGAEVNANRDVIDKWESFRLITVS